MKKYEAPEALTIEFVVTQVIAASMGIGPGGDEPATREWSGDSWDDDEE